MISIQYVQSIAVRNSQNKEIKFSGREGYTDSAINYIRIIGKV